MSMVPQSAPISRPIELSAQSNFEEGVQVSLPALDYRTVALQVSIG